jgi:hypothetical protein
MINLLVDEAYAFDYLAILLIKLTSDAKNQNKITAYIQCAEHLTNQLGEKKFQEIITTPEYKEIISANQRVFDLVDSLRENVKITANQIDDANLYRYKAKQKFQINLFNTFIVEEKTKI